MPFALARFYQLWGEISDLDSTQELLSWDQETMMPRQGGTGRAEVAATIAGLRHRALTSPELVEGIESLSGADLDREDADQIRQARWHVERAVKVPESLIKEIASAASAGTERWQEARRLSDYSVFAPSLDRLVELHRQLARALDLGDDDYDSLLDAFEPGMTVAQLVPIFTELEDRLPALVESVVESGVVVDDSPALGEFSGEFSEEGQLELGRWIAEHLGFDFDRGRFDRSVHPFCLGLNPGDVRITWRAEADDFRPGLFGILHEVGHGLYEQGLPAEWRRTPLGVAASMGVHESQSRLWENHVGRHSGFWEGIIGRFNETFPTSATTVDSLWPTLHKIERSLIRVHADEVTYSLHILVRFRLERALLSGDLSIDDLPAAWSDAYDDLLGIRPQNDVEGVLQDIHWSQGLFGYFPTYCLGSLLSAQLFEAAERDLGDQHKAFSQLDFGPLLEWLRDHVHSHGARRSFAEIAEQATGKPLSCTAFLDYVEATAQELYGIGS